MNDLLLFQELAAVLSGDGYSTFRDAMRPTTKPDGSTPEDALAPNIFAAQAAGNTSRPILVISGQFDNYGPRRKGTVTFDLRGRMGDDEGGGDHQSRFDLLWTALMGAQGADDATTRANAATARAALKTALAARNNVTIDDYGPAPQNAFVADVDGEDLRTALTLRIAWAFTPPA